MTDLPDRHYLRPDEVAEFLSVSLATVYRWRDIGILVGVKINGTLRITRESVEDHLSLEE